MGIVLFVVFSLWIFNNTRSLRKLIYSFKGVYVCESVVPGSDFRDAEFPSCQIPVYRGGVFSNTFIGYSIRISNCILAMPQHVYMAAKPDIIIGDEKQYDITNEAMVVADSVSDLVYIKLSEQCFTGLGATVARFPKQGITGFVTVVGRQGASSGTMVKHTTNGLVLYQGSTLNGYSGAPYTIGRYVYGMHIGSAGKANLGISYVVLAHDLVGLFKMTAVHKEGSILFSSPSLNGGFEEDYMDTEQYWYESEWKKNEDWSKMGKRARRSAKRDWESKQYHVAGFDDVLFENESAEDVLEFLGTSSVEDLEKFKALTESQLKIRKKTKPVEMTGQSDEPERVVVQTNSPSPTKQQIFEMVMENRLRIEALTDRVNDLGKIPKEKEHPRIQPKPSVALGRYLCPIDNCNKNFPKIVAVIGHISSAHKIEENDIDLSKIVKYSGESALTDDASPVVGNKKPFLFKKRFPPKKKNFYQNTSSSEESDPQLTSLAQSLKSMENSLKSLPNILRDIVINSRGPDSGTRQN